MSEPQKKPVIKAEPLSPVAELAVQSGAAVVGETVAVTVAFAFCAAPLVTTIAVGAGIAWLWRSVKKASS